MTIPLISKIGNYLFPGWKCPHACKGAHWWQINEIPINMERKGGNYLFPGWKCPHACKRAHWWQINEIPINMEKMWLAQTQWFLISCKGLCTQIVQTNLEFQFMTTIVMSMATKSSNLDDHISGANLQNDGHTPTSPSDWKGLEEMGASGSAPSHSPSWSPERQPSPGHSGTQYCLGICVTLTKKRGAAPPAPHIWMVPVVEDMLWHGWAGITKAVVTGPGRAILFYGRHSLGGLNLGEVRDATFPLTGAGTWVGKLAHLATDPLSIQEDWQVIA